MFYFVRLFEENRFDSTQPKDIKPFFSELIIFIVLYKLTIINLSLVNLRFES